MRKFDGDITRKIGISEAKLFQVGKTTEFRWNWRAKEIIVVEYQTLEMAKREKCVVGIKRALKTAITQVKANYMP